MSSVAEPTWKVWGHRIMRFIARGDGAPWWAWPAFLAVLGAAVLGVSLWFEPGANEWVYVNGWQFGEECGFVTVTGLPCPQCGMTRSWVHAARGNLVQSFFYNPAGLTLFFWAQVAGVFGVLRLIKRDPEFLKVPGDWLGVWAAIWIVALYLAPWLGRIAFGINPLPLPY